MLAHAYFERLKKDLVTAEKKVEVQFNPSEFTMTKGAQIADINIPGLDAPLLQFVRGQNETMTMDLFFDSTEGGTGDAAVAVTTKTDEFYQLIKIDRKTHAIPICRFGWGKGTFPGGHLTDRWVTQNASRNNGFNCIVENVKQRFTMFSPAGAPLRATLTVQLREYRTLEQQIEQLCLESPDHTHTHVVREGETLSRIAENTYGDPREWRAIADHNALSDPLDLLVGQTLEIPPIR